jgi:hypothetical protein
MCVVAVLALTVAYPGIFFKPMTPGQKSVGENGREKRPDSETKMAGA